MSTVTRLCISLPPDHSPEEADILGGLLALHVSHGWEEANLPTGELACVVHYTVPESARDLAALLADRLPRACVNSQAEEETNWVEAWKEFFTPVEAGSHFMVLAPWMKEELAATRRIPIIIEPKTAFGTGHHATTALCLGLISRLFEEGTIKPGMRFLDLGTGSGILGLAMAKLGLHGQGLDIDPPAVDNALENRTVNAISPEAFSVSLGGVEAARGPYDLIVANILAAPLRDMAPAIAALPGGSGNSDNSSGSGQAPARGDRPLLLLSGILDIQAQSVAEAYCAQGYAPPQKTLCGEWAALAFGLP